MSCFSWLARSSAPSITPLQQRKLLETAIDKINSTLLTHNRTSESYLQDLTRICTQINEVKQEKGNLLVRKSRLRVLVTRRKQMLQLIETIQMSIGQLETMLNAARVSILNIDTVGAMHVTKDALQHAERQLNLDKLDQLASTLQSLFDDQEEVSRLLMKPVIAGDTELDEREIEKELNDLLEPVPQWDLPMVPVQEPLSPESLHPIPLQVAE